jgi:hypothetical protein
MLTVIDTHAHCETYPEADFIVLNENKEILGVMAHACNPSTGKAEAMGSTVQGQPGLYP